jgi:uncharacterized protein
VTQDVKNTAPSRRLVVALHDVAPPFEREIRLQLERLEALDVRPLVLKVVPNWQGKYPLIEHPAFVELLRARERDGDQIVLHGWEHIEHGPLRGSAASRIRAALFARHSAEFLSLTREHANLALTRGLEILGRCGLPFPSTFCAPAWLIAPDARLALADAGLRYLAGMLTLVELESSRRVATPAFGYMGSGQQHEIGIRLLGAGMRTVAMKRAGLGKAFFHPLGGVESPAARRVLEQTARLVGRGWRPVTFDEILR